MSCQVLFQPMSKRLLAATVAALTLAAVSAPSSADDAVAPGMVRGLVGGVIDKSIPRQPPPPQSATQPAVAVPAAPPVVAGDTVVVTLKNDHGVFKVPVKINNAVTIDFVLDSGASKVTLPEDVVHTLMRSGTITQKNMVGETTVAYADGRTAKQTVFRLDSVQVGDRVIRNVLASTVAEEGQPLLGQSFLSQFASWTQNTSNGTLILKLPSGVDPAKTN